MQAFEVICDGQNTAIDYVDGSFLYEKKNVRNSGT